MSGIDGRFLPLLGFVHDSKFFVTSAISDRSRLFRYRIRDEANLVFPSGSTPTSRTAPFSLVCRPGNLHAPCASRAMLYCTGYTLQPHQPIRSLRYQQHVDEHLRHSAQLGWGVPLRGGGVLLHTGVQQQQNVEAKQQQQGVGKGQLQQDGCHTEQLHSGALRKQQFAVGSNMHVLHQQGRATVARLQQLAKGTQQQQRVGMEQQHVVMQQAQQQQRVHQQNLKSAKLRTAVPLQQRRRFQTTCSSKNRADYMATRKHSAAAIVSRETQQVAGLQEEQQQEGQAVHEEMRQRLRCIYTPVLIVGGGPVGLSFALLLGRMGVPCVVVEKEEEAGCQPKAHYCSNRSMEVWRTLEHLDEELDEATPSLDDWRHFSYCTHIVPSVKDKVTHVALRDHFEGHHTYTTCGGKKRYFEAFSPCKVGHVPQHIVLPLLYSRLYEAAAGAYSSSCPRTNPWFSSVPNCGAVTSTAAAFPGGPPASLASPSSLIPPASAPGAAAAAAASQDALPLYTRLFNKPLPPPSLALLPPSTQQRLLRLRNSSSNRNSYCSSSYNSGGSGSSKRSGNSSNDSHDSCTARKSITNCDIHNPAASNDTGSTSVEINSTSASLLHVPTQGRKASSLTCILLAERQQLLCVPENGQPQHQNSHGRSIESRHSSLVRDNQSSFSAAATAFPRSSADTQRQPKGVSCEAGVKQHISSSPGRTEQRPGAVTAVASNQRKPASAAANVKSEELSTASNGLTFQNAKRLLRAAVAAASAIPRERDVVAAAARRSHAPAAAADTQQELFREQRGQSGEQHLQQVADHQQQQELGEALLPVPEILFGTEWLAAELRETRENSQPTETDLYAALLRSRHTSNRSNNRKTAAFAKLQNRNANRAFGASSSSSSSSSCSSSSTSFHPPLSQSSISGSPSSPSFFSVSRLASSSSEASAVDFRAAGNNDGGTHMPGRCIRSLVQHTSKDGVSTPLLIESALVFACDGAKSCVAASLDDCSMHGVEGEVQHLLNITFSSQHLANLIRSSEYMENVRNSLGGERKSVGVPAGGDATDVEGSRGERGSHKTTKERSRSFEGTRHAVQGSDHYAQSSNSSRMQAGGVNAPRVCSGSAKAEIGTAQGNRYDEGNGSSVAGESTAAAASSPGVSDASLSCLSQSPPFLSCIPPPSPHSPLRVSPSSPFPPPLQPSCTYLLPEAELATAAASSVSPLSRSSSDAFLEGMASGASRSSFHTSRSLALLPVATVAAASPVKNQPHAVRRRSVSPPSMLYYVMNEHVVGVVVLHSLSRGEFVAHIPYFPLFTSSSKSMHSTTRTAPFADFSSGSVPSWAALSTSSLAFTAAPPDVTGLPSCSPACAVVSQEDAVDASSFVSPSPPLPSSSAPFHASFRCPPSSCSSTRRSPLSSLEERLCSETSTSLPFSRMKLGGPDKRTPLVNSDSLSFIGKTPVPGDDNCSIDRRICPTSTKATTTTKADGEWIETVQQLAGVQLRDLRIFEARGWRMTAKVASSFVFRPLPAKTSSCSSAAPASAAAAPAAIRGRSSSPLSFWFAPSDAPCSPAAAAAAFACCAGTCRPALGAASKNMRPPVATDAAKYRGEVSLDPEPKSTHSYGNQNVQQQMWQGVQQQLQHQLLRADSEQRTPQKPRAQYQGTRREQERQPQQLATQEISEASSAAPATPRPQASSAGKGTLRGEEMTLQAQTNPSQKCPRRDSNEQYPLCCIISTNGAPLRPLPRIVLLGDAAHQLPPAGGLGMNLGIGDAVALAWRVAQLYHSGLLSIVDSSGNDCDHSSSSCSSVDYNRSNNRDCNGSSKACNISRRGESGRSSDNRDCISSRTDSSTSNLIVSSDHSCYATKLNDRGSNSKNERSARETKTQVNTTAKWSYQSQVKTGPENELELVKTNATRASPADTWCRLLKSFDEERRLVAMYACRVAVDNFQRGLEVPAALGLDLQLGDKISGKLLAAAAAAEEVVSTCVDWLQPETIPKEQGTVAAVNARSPPAALGEALGGAVADSPSVAKGAAAAGTAAAAAAAVGLSAAVNAAATAAKAASQDRVAVLSSSSMVKEKMKEVPFEIAKRAFDAVVAVAKNQVTLCRRWIPPLWERRCEHVERILSNENENLGMIYYGVDLAYAYASSALYKHPPRLLAPALALSRESSPVRGLSTTESAAGEVAGNGAQEAAGRGGAATGTRGEMADKEAAGAASGLGGPARHPATLMVSRSPFHYEPTSWIGCRVPHTWLYCTVEAPQCPQETAYRLSTVDLPFIHYPSCAYCFLVFSSRHVHTLQQALLEAAEEKFAWSSTEKFSRPDSASRGTPAGATAETATAAPAALSTARSSPVPSTSLSASSSASCCSHSPVLFRSTASPFSSPATGGFPSNKAAAARSAADTAQQQRFPQWFAFSVCWEPTTALAKDAKAGSATSSRVKESEKTFIHRRPFALQGGVAALQLLGARSVVAAATACAAAAEATAEPVEGGCMAPCGKHLGDIECMSGTTFQQKQLLQHRLLSKGAQSEGLQMCEPDRDLTPPRKTVRGKESGFGCENRKSKSAVDTRFVWSSEKRREAFLAAMENEIRKRLPSEQRTTPAIQLDREDFLVVLRPDAHILAISYVGEDPRYAIPTVAAAASSSPAPAAGFATAADASGMNTTSTTRTRARLRSIVLDVVRRLP